MGDPSIALVHERLTELGGSEKVVDVLAGGLGATSLFVPIRDRRGMGLDLDRFPTATSPLQRLYRHDGRYAHLLPLLPLSFRSFDPGPADVVLISHHAFANRVSAVVRDRPLVSYVHSPARWMWDARFRAAEVSSRAGRGVLATFSAAQRPLDRAAAHRLTTVLANSTEVARRIERWWERHADVVPPPIDVDFFTPGDAGGREDFFLYAGRLVGYKRPDVAIRAAQRAGVSLVVAGEGREMERCRAIAGPETSFVGAVNDHQLLLLFRRCQALIFPGLEDFGMVPVEAQATGTPVLGLGHGGIRDSVLDGGTGVWVGSDAEPHHTDALVASFAEAMTSFDAGRFDPAKIRAHAEQFGVSSFLDRMRAVLRSLA